MKKFLSILLFLLCLTVAANAQSSCETPTNVTVSDITTNSASVSWTGSSEQYNVLYLNNLFYCGADDDCIDGWQSYDADGDGNGWGRDYVGRSGASDDYAFVSHSYSGGELDPDNWLITPIIDLGGTMSVWMKSYSPYYLDTFAIYLTTDLDFDEVEDFNIPLVVKSVAPDEWTEYTADLSAYAGQQGRIAIRHFDSYDRWALLMDDFRVDEEIMLSNVSSPAELSGLTPEITNQVQVQAICTSGVSEWSDPVGFTTHGLCDAPSNLSVTPRATTASLEWTGYQDQYTVRYQTLESYNSYAPTVTLTAGDVWDDGSGYQMLLDADATAYGSIIPKTGGLTTSGDASEAVYAAFEYKIPTNADGSLNTSNMVLNSSVTISIPAGTYDYCITNPTPGNRMWIATNNGTANGRENDYVFETGKAYEFEVTLGGSNDQVDLTITDNIPEDSWTTVTNVSNPAEIIIGLNPETTYIVQVQGICEDGVTAWTELVEFTTTEEAEPCLAPTNVTVTNITATDATVSWTGSGDSYELQYAEKNSPDNPEAGEWLQYDDGVLDASVGAFGYPLSWAAVYPSSMLNGNNLLTKVSIYEVADDITSDITLNIYSGGDNAPGTLLHTQTVTPMGTNGFHEIALTAPIAIDNTQNLWISLTAAGEKPAAAYYNPGELDYNQWLSLDGETWSQLDDKGVTGRGWMIRGYMQFSSNVSEWITEDDAVSPYDITGLTPETEYVARIRANCGENQSEWSYVFFTTEATSEDPEDPEDPEEPEEPEEPVSCDPVEDCDGHDYPTVKIGDVCWMAKNLAAESCVTSGNFYAYVNDQFPDEDANVETYGLLYDEDAAMQGNGAKAAATGICPEGYTLPTTEQFEYLKNNFTVEELRNSTGWVVNTGTNGTGFSWDGSGFRNGTSETFEHLLLEGYLWAVDMTSGTPQPAMYKMMYYCNEIVRVYDFDGISASIRCVKDAEPQPEPEPEPFRCGTSNLKIGENSYETVQIGTQCWTKTNLRETKDKNGNTFINGITAEVGSFNEYEDAVIYIPTEETWNWNISVPYDENTLGYFYNWTAAQDVCPDGWHLPSDEEWTLLEDYVSNAQDEEGNFLYRCDPSDATSIAKALASETSWSVRDGVCYPGDQTVKPNNTTGFSAVPAGAYTSSFVDYKLSSIFWSSSSDGYTHSLYISMAFVTRFRSNMSYGFSVRCLRD